MASEQVQAAVAVDRQRDEGAGVREGEGEGGDLLAYYVVRDVRLADNPPKKARSSVYSSDFLAHRTDAESGWGELPCTVHKIHPLLLKHVGSARETREKIRRECDLLAKLQHPNVVRFFGVYEDPRDRGESKSGGAAGGGTTTASSQLQLMQRERSLVTEWIPLDLERCVVEARSDTAIPLSVKLSLLQDVSYGLLYLHSMKPDPIVHRDLTATNVLLTRDLRAKIANAGVSENLGLSAQILAVFNKSSNILSYMPPEVLTDSSPPKFGEKLDCFSFGHLALFLVNQEFPFCSHHHHSSVGADAQKKGVTELVKRKKHLDKMGKKHCLYKTVATCLNDFPQLRLSSQELVTELSNLCFVHPKSSSEMAKSCSFIKELWETFDSKAVENEIKRTSTPVFASSARAGSVDPPTSSASPAPKKDRRLSFRASSSNGSSYHEFKQVSALEKEIEDLKQVLERVRDELERETKKNEHHEKHSHSHRPRFGSRAELGDYEELLRKGLHEMTNLCKTKARELKELHEQNDGLVSAIEQLKQTELKHLIPQSVYDLVEEARKSMGGLDHTEANISLAKASANKTATKKNQITNASTSSNASSTAANEGKPLAINGKGGGTTNNTATNANSTKTVSASKESGESDTTPKRNESVGKGLWESIDMFGSEMQDALDKVMSLNKSGLS